MLNWASKQDSCTHMRKYRDQTCFQCINICWTQGGVETRALKLKMLVYQKTIFDSYYCIKSFCHLKTLDNVLKSLFCITIMARKSKMAWYTLKRLFQSKDIRHPNVILLHAIQ